MSGSKTISNSATKIEALKLQSSSYGATIPVVGGVTRLPGNLVYYDDFKAVPTTTSQGGKGGGVKVQETTFQYFASVLMGVCHGQITSIPRIWRGKKVYADGGGTNTYVADAASYSVPGGGGEFTVPTPSTFGSNVSVSMSINDGDGIYYGQAAEGIDYTVSNGVYTFPITTRASGAVNIAFTRRVTTAGDPAMVQLGATLLPGTLTQASPSWVTSLHPTKAIPYAGLALVSAADYDLGPGAQVENHQFEVVAQGAYSLGATIPDIDPTEFTARILLDARYGARVPAGAVGDWTQWSQYCVANNILMSPALTEQAPCAEFLALMAKLTNTAPVWSGGRLKMIPFGDSAATGNGVTFTPDLTPVYDLTDDAFITDGADAPVKVTRKKPSEAFNHIRIEFQNRANAYAPEIAEAKDQADIDTSNLRSAEVLKAWWICDGAVARSVAQLLLQRSLYVRATYEFSLPWHFAFLEPMDLVTINDASQGIVARAVRIIAVEESGGALRFTAEDFTLGVANAATYGTQVGAGFVHDYNVAPGNALAPVVFEAPVELTTTGLELYIAAAGVGANWGGCRVWVSMDGTNYREVGKISGANRYGTLTASMTNVTTAASVLLKAGALTSGSAADAVARTTLCFIGGANKEFVSFETASLTGALAYNLGGIVRAAYGTAGASHSSGDPFVRVDSAIAKSGPLDLSMIGKTVYVKLTSFNVYGAAEESIAEVSATGYIITGYMANLPPSTPAAITAASEAFGVRLSCAASPQPDVARYEWRIGSAWNTATLLAASGGTSYLWSVQTTGSYTAWVSAVDALGNYSTPGSVSFNVTAPSVTGLTASITGPDLTLTWVGTSTQFAIAGYEVRYGATFAGGTSVGQFQLTRYTRRVDWTGDRRWWVAPVDVKGNLGTEAVIDTTIAPPGVVTLRRSEVVDNNVLLYWSPPATGALPVDRYEVRKGATWAGGQVVGSNGNSTFAAVFEQQSGTFTYWMTAYDSAGNAGTPASVVATVSQPPDYVLRTNIDSTFSGTLTNMVLDGGTLVGPVSTTETWSTHFSTRGYTSPQSQVTAGFPLYIEPSATSGSYAETFDYGSVLPSTTITASLNSTIVDGAVTAACQIAYKTLVGDPWTNATAGATNVLAAGFRYVQVTWTFTATAGANVIRVNGFNLKLSSKLKTDSGVGTITTAATGVLVNFGVSFIDADTPLVQPMGATPLIPVVDFTDTPNPTSFRVYLYNLSGSTVTGSFSWTARGY